MRQSRQRMAEYDEMELKAEGTAAEMVIAYILNSI